MSLLNLATLFAKKSVSNEKFISSLNNMDDFLDQFNKIDVNNQVKVIKALSKIEPIREGVYSNLYFKLSKIKKLWETKTHYDMTLLNYMAYGYDDSFYDCLYELTKYPELWNIQEPQLNHTALHFIIMSIKNYGKYKAISLLVELSKHHYIWKTKSKSEETALHELCSFRIKTIEEVLFELCKEPNLWKQINSKYMTPLHYLCTTYDKEHTLDVLMKLSEHPELWKIQDELLYTPFHIACRSLTDDIYDSFFTKMRDYPEIWQIKNKGEKTPEELYEESHYDLV